MEDVLNVTGNFIGGIRIGLILAVIAYLFFFNQRKACRLPLTLVISGAIGNLIDFALYGHVVDMLHFVFWGFDYPVFNLADSAIFIGIFWLILLSLFPERPEAKEKP